MATRGSIPKIMEAAGIDMLPPEAGVATVRRELTAGGTRGEIVVAGRLGMMGTEFDPAGGLDLEKIDVSTSGPMAVSYTHLRAHETPEHLVCRLLLEKKKNKNTQKKKTKYKINNKKQKKQTQKKK